MKAPREAATQLRRGLRLPPPGRPMHESLLNDIGGRTSRFIIML